MENLGFLGFILTNLFISTLIFLAIKYTKKRWLMNLAITLFYGVSLWNLFIYILSGMNFLSGFWDRDDNGWQNEENGVV